MRGDPTTEIKATPDGRYVVHHCFFDVRNEHDDWERYRDQFVSHGCDVRKDVEGRLNFVVTLPEGSVHHQALQRGGHPIDVFVLPDGAMLSILRPNEDRSCRTLLLERSIAWLCGKLDRASIPSEVHALLALSHA